MKYAMLEVAMYAWVSLKLVLVCQFRDVTKLRVYRQQADFMYFYCYT